MISKERTSLILKYSDQILELIDQQLRDDDNSMSRGDLQARVEAIVMNILNED